VHQAVWHGRVWAARPLTVVADEDDRLLLWMPYGTRRKIPVTPPHRPDPATLDERLLENLTRRDWIFGDQEWDVSCLWIVRPGDWFSIWVSWRPDGSHYGWYVNLQRPYRHTSIGIEAMDLMLDVVVEPDLSWRWKDAEQFDDLVARSVFDSETASTVRKAATSVIARVEARQPPFDEPWPSWRPDPSWRRPELVPGWDDPTR